MRRQRPTIIMTRGDQTAAELVIEYAEIGRKAVANGNFVTLHPYELRPKKKRRDDDQ